MTPDRRDVITLFCEDRKDGRSQKLIEKAIGALSDVPFASAVSPIGVLNKSDVHVRAKFARADKVRSFAVRDRDFLTRNLVDRARQRTFAPTAQDLAAWPLTRHSIESYLLDDDVLETALKPEELGRVRDALAPVAAARLWLDLTRATLDDLAYRARQIRQQDIGDRPTDRTSALTAVERVAAQMRLDLAGETDEARLVAHFDTLAADIVVDGPLHGRVDGREMLYDLDVLLDLPKGYLLDKLTHQAHRSPPAALVADLRAVLAAVPSAWRVVD